MLHVELEDGFAAAAAVLAFEQALQFAIPPLRARHQAGGAVGQARRGLHLRHLVAEHLLGGLQHRGIVLDRIGAGLLGLLFVDERDQAEIDFALAQRLERLAFEFLRHRRPEGIDRIGQQQHLDAARLRGLELGIGLQTVEAVAHQIVDLRLVGLQVGHILLDRARRVAGRRGETRETEQLGAPLLVLVESFLEDRAEGLPDLAERLGILRRGAFQLRQDTADETRADLADLRIVLQHLARQVEWQVLAVDHAAHEAQIGREQLGIVGDVDAAYVELDPPLARRIGEIERRRARHEQQHRIGLPPLDLVVQGQRRLVERHGDRAIGLRVVLRRHFGLGALPQRAGGVDLPRLALVVDQFDREQHVVGIGPHDALQLVGLEVARRVFLEVQHDLRAARHARRLFRRGGRHLEAGAAGGGPGPGLGRAGAAAGHLDAVGHHEGGVEADAELADQAQPVLGVLQPLQEGLGAGARQGAEIVDQLLAVHAYAVVGDGQRLGLGIRLDADRQTLVAGQKLGPGDGLVADLVAGIRGIRHQLAQEDVGLGIDRVDHQVEKLGHFGLELVLLRAALGCRTVDVHCALIPRGGFSGGGYRKRSADGKSVRRSTRSCGSRR